MFRTLAAILLLNISAFASLSNACMRINPLSEEERGRLTAVITTKIQEMASTNGRTVAKIEIRLEDTGGGAEGDCGALSGRGTATLIDTNAVESKFTVSAFLSSRLGDSVTVRSPRPPRPAYENPLLE